MPGAFRDVWTDRLATGWLFWPAMVAGVVLVGLAILGPDADTNLDVKRQCAVMQAEVDALSQTRAQDVAIVRALKEDPVIIEGAARQELGLVKPGEVRLPGRIKPAVTKESPEAAEPVVHPALRTLAMFDYPLLRFSSFVAGGAILLSIIVLSLPGRKRRFVPAEG
jgi:cell division protein FtsB